MHDSRLFLVRVGSDTTLSLDMLEIETVLILFTNSLIEWQNSTRKLTGSKIKCLLYKSPTDIEREEILITFQWIVKPNYL